MRNFVLCLATAAACLLLFSGCGYSRLYKNYNTYYEDRGMEEPESGKTDAEGTSSQPLKKPI